MAKKTGVTETLNIDELLALIIEGKTFREMASKYNASVSIIHKFISSDEHSARAREALELSAAQYANKAEEALLDAEPNLIEIQRARELAQHYRWMASKRAPKQYGDKIDVTSEGKGLIFAVGYKKKDDTDE